MFMILLTPLGFWGWFAAWILVPSCSSGYSLIFYIWFDCHFWHPLVKNDTHVLTHLLIFYGYVQNSRAPTLLCSCRELFVKCIDLTRQVHHHIFWIWMTLMLLGTVHPDCCFVKWTFALFCHHCSTNVVTWLLRVSYNWNKLVDNLQVILSFVLHSCLVEHKWTRWHLLVLQWMQHCLSSSSRLAIN